MYLFLSALCICVYCVLLYDMFIGHFCLMCWAHCRAPMSRIFRVFYFRALCMSVLICAGLIVCAGLID